MNLTIEVSEDGYRVRGFGFISKEETSFEDFEGVPVTQDDEAIGYVQSIDEDEDGNLRATIKVGEEIDE